MQSSVGGTIVARTQDLSLVECTGACGSVLVESGALTLGEFMAL